MRNAYMMDADETKKWEEQDDIHGVPARRAIREAAAEMIGYGGCGRVEIYSDDGVVMDAVEVTP